MLRVGVKGGPHQRDHSMLWVLCEAVKGCLWRGGDGRVRGGLGSRLSTLQHPVDSAARARLGL